MDNSSVIYSAEEAFSIWAPENGQWSNWVKPAVFASMDGKANTVDSNPIIVPEVSWHSPEIQRSALILDLPSDQSIWESIALLKFHYQPVPLFNCCREAGMVIEVGPIVQALWKAAKVLKDSSVSKDGLPVFLLDSNRLSHKELLTPGKFDNRWCVLPQDMPSAAMLKSKGVNSVCLRTNKLENDVAHILNRYQVDGLKVLVQDASSQSLQNFSMPKSGFFRSIWYRIEVLAGLKRNAAGGFGAIIPMPSSSGG